MDKSSPEKFFGILGEIWRDICLIEFLMRCALAQKKGDISKFPMPPYEKGKEYSEYPDSFSIRVFGDVVTEFNESFPNLAIPDELIAFRNAMAHGLIAEIDHDGIDRLIKFRKQKNNNLKVEFSMDLEIERIEVIKNSLQQLRRHVGVEAEDK